MKDGGGGLLRWLRRLEPAGLAVAGALALFLYPMDASALAATSVFLGVSAMGWFRLLRRPVEDAVLDASARDLALREGARAVVQLVPPVIFAISATYHLDVGSVLSGNAFLAGAALTSVPPVGLFLRARKLARIASGDGVDALPSAGAAGPALLVSLDTDHPRGS